MRSILVCKILLALVLLVPTGAFCDDISIGCMFGLTGDSAEFGKGELDAVTLAAEEWNSKGGIDGKKIVLDVEDTGSTQTKIVSAYKKLTDIGGHKFIIGPTWLDTFQAILPLAEKKEVLLITPSAEGRAFHHANPQSPWALTTYYSSQQEIKALLHGLKTEGVKRIIGLYTEEPYFLLVRKLIEEGAPNEGLEIVASENIDMHFSDFRSLIPKFKKLNPDAVLLMLTSEESIINFLRARSEQMPSVKVAGVHDFEGFLQKEEIRKLANNLLFPKFHMADASFAERFHKRFGYDPILTHSNAYDAANMVFKALAAGKTDGLSMRDYLLKEPLETVTFGSTHFSPQGLIEATRVSVEKFLDGKETTL